MIFDLKAHAGRVALIEDGDQLTYDELTREGAQVAGAIGRRTLAFVLCANERECIAGYTGMINAGIVPLMVDPELDEALLANLVATYRPTHIWGRAQAAAKLDGFAPAWELGRYALFENPAADAPDLHPDLALLVSTSGSTGTPKLVRLSAQNIVSNARSIVEYLAITPDERAITSLPLSYVYGLSVLHSHLIAGASLALTNQACYTGGFWRLFAEAGCTSFAGVPFMYEMLDRLKFADKPAPFGLRTLTQAGGRLSPELQDKFAAFARDNDLNFFVMYGASEATARMSYLPPEASLAKRGSIGIPIPGGAFELVDSQGNVLEGANAEGELVYLGDNVSLGYATEDADLALGDVNCGRLATGDLALRDEEGYYYIVGRLKRFVKLLGKRFSLDEVEYIVRQAQASASAQDACPGEMACAGRDDLLHVYATTGELAELARKVIVEKLAVNPRMVQTSVIECLPRSSAGKVLYSALSLGES